MSILENFNPSPECTDVHKCLANYLLPLKGGDQLHSTRELAELFGVSLGTISAAINELEGIGAVVINRRGRLGSFLEGKSIGALWRLVENRPMVIALTLPTFPKCEGLATAMYSLLNSAEVETYLIFIRGSHNRIKALRSGQCHAAVLSVLAADESCSKDEQVILRLPAESFVSDHRLYYRRKTEKTSRRLRVGIDRESFDLVYLTELEFADQDVEFHEMPFTQIDRFLEKSSVDAAISNIDHIERLISNEIASRPLSPRVQALLDDRDTSAALVVRSGADPVITVLREVLVPEEVIEIQQKVVDGLLVPRY